MFVFIFKMKIISGIFAFVCISIINGQTPGSTESDLKRILFTGYDTFVRPVNDPSQPIQVWANLSPVSLLDVDVSRNIVKMDTWLFMTWENEFLTWDPNDYGGITEIRVSPSEIWTPDINLYSGTPDYNVVPPPITRVFVYHNGTNLWVLPFTVNTHCADPEINGNTYRCTALLGSWTYPVDLLNLLPYPNSFTENPVHKYYNANPYWSLESIVINRVLVDYYCVVFCDAPFAVLRFEMTYRKVDGDIDGSEEESSEESYGSEEKKSKEKNSKEKNSKEKNSKEKNSKEKKSKEKN